MYTEEKFEDEEDLRERTRVALHRMREDDSTNSELQAAIGDLSSAMQQHEEANPIVIDIIKSCVEALDKEMTE